MRVKGYLERRKLKKSFGEINLISPLKGIRK
jgi:hypothetical protein